jgi:hypothetical protein
MSADDAVRLLNLAGSIVLFVAAYRGPRWIREQADSEEDAAVALPPDSTPAPVTAPASYPTPTPAEKPRSAGAALLAKPGDFQRAGADVLGRAFFDRPAYLLLCVGFAITTVASGVDLYSHHTVSHLWGAPAVAEAKSCAASESTSAHTH